MFVPNKIPVYLPKIGSVYTFKDDYITRRVFSERLWEKHILDVFDNNLTHDSVVLDVGANIGLHSLYLSRFVDQVYSFEPVKPTFDLFTKNVEMNRRQNIHPIRLGLSNTSKVLHEVFIPMYEINSGCSRIENNIPYPQKSYPVDIQLCTLDEWVNNNPLTRIDLIKIDIEGHEVEMIQGAINTINKFKPKIVVETDKELFALDELGYTRTLLHPSSNDYFYQILKTD